MSLTNTLKTAYKKGKDIAMNAPEIERKVKDATSNDKWGPTGTQMQEISRSTYNFHDFPVIMGVIWKRINDPGKYWRHVYKSLLLIDYLVRNGSEQVIRDCRMHVIEIQTLTEFQYIEEEKDVGLSVRERAKQVIELLHDDKRIKIEREKAKANRDKYVGVGNGAPGGGRYGGDSYSGGGYGDGGYGDSGDYGGDRDSYGGNRDSYGGNRDSYGGNRDSYGGNRERGDSYGGGNRDRDSYGGGGDRDSYGGRGGSDYGYGGGDNGYRGDDDEGRYEEPNRYEDNNQYDRPSSGREYEQPQKPTRTNSSSNPSSNTSSNSAQSSNRRPRAPSGGQEQLQAPNSQLFAIDDVMNAPQPQMRQSASDSLFEAFGENTGQFGGSQGAHGAFFPPASGGGGGGGGSLFDSNPPSSQGFDAFNPRGQDQGDFGEFQSSQNEGFNPFDQQQQGGGNDPFGVQQQQQQPEKKEADPWAKKELFNLDSLNVTEKPGQPRTSTGPSPSKTPMAAMSKTPMVVSKGPTISSGTTINSTPMGRGMGGPNYNLGTGMPGGYPNPGGYPPMQPGGYPNPGGYPPQPGFPPGAGMFPQPPFYGGAPPGTMGGTMGGPMGGTMGAPMGGTMGGPMGSGGFTMNMTNNNAPKRY